MQGVGKNENPGNNQRLPRRIEDFCSEVQSLVLAILLAGQGSKNIFLPGSKTSTLITF